MITIKQIKNKGRWKARSSMSEDELIFFKKLIDKKRKESIDSKLLLESNILSCDEGIIISPLYIHMERKEVPDVKYSLNMNTYRNWHHIISNDLKVEYKNIMESQLKGKVFGVPLHIEYKIFYDREPDGMNVASLISKFLLDAMQENKCIPDDKISMVTESYSSGGRDKNNPRCEIKIIN